MAERLQGFRGKNEMQNKAYCGIFAAVLVATAFFAGAGDASAQNTYGFPRGVTHDLIRRIARSAEDRSDDFKGELRRSLNQSGLDGSNREDRLNEQARRLERALDRVKKGVDKRKSYGQIQGDVRDAVRAGKEINFTVSNRWRGSSIEREWRRLRSEVNALAKTVNVGRI